MTVTLELPAVEGLAAPLAAGALYLLAFLVAGALTGVVRHVLLRLGSVDRPRDTRWHRQAVPRPGGPALYLTWLFLLLILYRNLTTGPLFVIVIVATLFFVLGLVDDVLRLTTVPKLILLIVGACLPPVLGVRFGAFPPVLAVPLTILWVLGITNAFNWLDNIDGLAAGIAAIVSAALTLQFLSANQPGLAGLSAITGGTALGFLLYNFHPARIFLGDSGSGFLGITLALLPIVGSAAAVSNVLTTLIVPVLILSVPIFDTLLVSLTRLVSGRPLLRGGTDHPSHRLVALGLSEQRAVLNLYLLSGLSGAVAVVAGRLDPLSGLVLTVVALSLFTALGVVLARVRVYPEGLIPRANGRVVTVMLLYKRRILEMGFDVALLAAAYVAAHLLRFEGAIPSTAAEVMAMSLPLVLAIKMSALYVSGLYRGEWRYLGLLDILPLLKATSLGSLLLAVALYAITHFVNVSRAALVLDWLLATVFLGGARLSIRLVQEVLAAQREGGRRTLIFGAGEAGLLLLSELRNNPGLGMQPVGFVDDDPRKSGAVIRGLRVLGSRHDIPALVERYRVTEVVIAAPTMTQREIERVQLICSEAGIPCRSMHRLLG